MRYMNGNYTCIDTSRWLLMEKIQHQWWISHVIQGYRVLDIPSGVGFCVVVQWCLMCAISTSAFVKAMTSRMRRMSSSQFRDKTFVEIQPNIAKNYSPSSNASVTDESSQDELVTFHCFPGLKVRSIFFWARRKPFAAPTEKWSLAIFWQGI